MICCFCTLCYALLALQVEEEKQAEPEEPIDHTPKTDADYWAILDSLKEKILACVPIWCFPVLLFAPLLCPFPPPMCPPCLSACHQMVVCQCLIRREEAESKQQLKPLMDWILTYDPKAYPVDKVSLPPVLHSSCWLCSHLQCRRM